VEHRIKVVVLAVFVAFLGLIGPRVAVAQYYGQEEEVSISLDKKVRYIHSEKYFDNIDAVSQVFFDGDLLDYKITVENTSTKDLVDIKVTDQLPANTEAVMWPGTLDSTLNKISWVIDRLNAGEAKDYLIRIRIVGVDKLALAGVMGLTNKVEVRAGEVSDEDTATIYVGQKSVPETGDNTLLAKTLVGLSLMLTSVGVRRLARGY